MLLKVSAIVTLYHRLEHLQRDMTGLQNLLYKLKVTIYKVLSAHIINTSDLE